MKAIAHKLTDDHIRAAVAGDKPRPPRPRRLVWRPTADHVCGWILLAASVYVGAHVVVWVVGRGG